MRPFLPNDEQPWMELGDGIRRKVVCHTPELMSVLVQFDRGAIRTPHAHGERGQIAYVLAGRFECTIDGRQRVLKPGDAFAAPRLTKHGVVALDDKAMLLDQFSPSRDDCA